MTLFLWIYLFICLALSALVGHTHLSFCQFSRRREHWGSSVMRKQERAARDEHLRIALVLLAIIWAVFSIVAWATYAK